MESAEQATAVQEEQQQVLKILMQRYLGAEAAGDNIKADRIERVATEMGYGEDEFKKCRAREFAVLEERRRALKQLAVQSVNAGSNEDAAIVYELSVALGYSEDEYGEARLEALDEAAQQENVPILRQHVPMEDRVEEIVSCPRQHVPMEDRTEEEIIPGPRPPIDFGEDRS